MAATIPIFEVEFDKHGNVFDSSQVKAVLDSVSERRVTDLLVFSHGWNNDMADARQLYREFFRKAEEMLEKHHGHQLNTRRFAALAVLWPSKKFTDEELIPSGDAASAEPNELDPVLQEQLENLKVDALRLGEKTPADAEERAALERAQAHVAKLEEDEDAQREFVKAIRSILPRSAAHADDGSEDLFLARRSRVAPGPVEARHRSTSDGPRRWRYESRRRRGHRRRTSRGPWRPVERYQSGRPAPAQFHHVF